eukprot:NODE_4396_length_1897_cov_4.832768.p1 GENE.NODE_4396_length_1897_cov_4.832768~~NODE_4396_length_1897_cov_4.832768.p1  ORF type:complete len:541 (-),score=79.15 NODE_4396_length_1897_cov_4.832768:168-1790(-)
MAFNAKGAPAALDKLDIDSDVLERYIRTHDRSLVLQGLNSVTFPLSKRRNVMKRGVVKPIYGMCLGMTECWYTGPVMSRPSRERPMLAKLICALARHEMPGFTFTSVQLNKNYAAALHVDKNDAGHSAIIGLGDYTGGQLWLDSVPNGVAIAPMAASKVSSGAAIDIRGRWSVFDGNMPHCVLPFRGQRYTIIYFTRLRGGDVGENPSRSFMGRRLLELGFALPPVAPPAPDHPPADERLAAAHGRRAAFCSRRKQRGGPSRIQLLFRDQRHGSIVRLSVRRGEPLLRSIREALAPQLGKGILHLGIGSLPLLSEDSPEGLGLIPDEMIDVVECDVLPSAGDHHQLHRDDDHRHHDPAKADAAAAGASPASRTSQASPAFAPAACPMRSPELAVPAPPNMTPHTAEPITTLSAPSAADLAHDVGHVSQLASLAQRLPSAVAVTSHAGAADGLPDPAISNSGTHLVAPRACATREGTRTALTQFHAFLRERRHVHSNSGEQGAPGKAGGNRSRRGVRWLNSELVGGSQPKRPRLTAIIDCF